MDGPIVPIQLAVLTPSILDAAVGTRQRHPLRLVSATRGGSYDEGESDWILLQEDCEAGSPLRAFLSRQASTPGHRRGSGD